MATTTNLNIRTEKSVKEAAEGIFAELGLNMTTAVNMFLRQTIRENGIPFSLKLSTPNEVTAAAIEEGRKLAADPNVKGYTNLEELSPKEEVFFEAGEEAGKRYRLLYAIGVLAEGKKLDQKYRDHVLGGSYAGCRECHIEPDWLLVYEVLDETVVLMLYRLGSHSELF